MSNQKNHSSIIEPWTISSCLGPHNICPKVWKNKFTDHEIHCGCNCHNNKNYFTNTNTSINTITGT